MLVGINLPWGSRLAGTPPRHDNSYGWDFGPVPPGWGAPSSPDDPNRPYGTPYWVQDAPGRPGVMQLRADLEEFRRVGMRVVRWWVLCDGLNYGHEDSLDPARGRLPQQQGTRWSFDPVRLPTEILDHLRRALDVFRTFNQGVPESQRVRLMPCFVSFGMCAPPPRREGQLAIHTTTGSRRRQLRYLAGGRADLLSGQPFRDPANPGAPATTKRDFFLEHALGPLLSLTSRPEYRDQIYAWDVMNEPEWATAPGYPGPDQGGGAAGRTVPWADMSAFLRDAVARVNAAGHASTIGFVHQPSLVAWHDAMGRPHGFRTTIDQFHYYGYSPRDTSHTQDMLPPKPRGWQRPMIVGEITSHPAGRFDLRRWRPRFHMPGDFDGRRSVLSMYDRLDWIHCAGGYDGALLWDATHNLDSLRPDPDDHELVGFWELPAVRSDVLRYTRDIGRGLRCPPVRNP